MILVLYWCLKSEQRPLPHYLEYSDAQRDSHLNTNLLLVAIAFFFVRASMVKGYLVWCELYPTHIRELTDKTKSALDKKSGILKENLLDSEFRKNQTVGSWVVVSAARLKREKI
jgi:hypothetical protein